VSGANGHTRGRGTPALGLDIPVCPRRAAPTAQLRLPLSASAPLRGHTLCVGASGSSPLALAFASLNSHAPHAPIPASTSAPDAPDTHHTLLAAFRLLCAGNRQARQLTFPPSVTCAPPSLTPAALLRQVSVENHAAALSCYTAALAQCVGALKSGVQTSRELGRIRLGNMAGMDAPTVEIHKHLAAALLCARSACWRRLGNAWRALCDAECAMETFVEWGTCHARLGEALESCGDMAAALRSYRRAVAFSPGVSEFQGRLDALLLTVLGLGSNNGSAPVLANPEARWVAQGGGPPRLWLPLRCATCTVALDLGASLFDSTDALSLGGIADCGDFYAEQQQLVEAALGVVAAHCADPASSTLHLDAAALEGVLEAGVEQERYDPCRKAFMALSVGCILSWLADYEAAAGFFSRAIEASEQGARGAQDTWLGTLLCNRALCRLRCGAASGAGEDAERARMYCPLCPRAHARCGDVAAAGGDWAQAASHYTASLKLCVPGSTQAMDAASRLAVASRAGRGASGALGGTPTVSPSVSPCGSPLLGGGGAGRAAMARSPSDSSLIEVLSLGGEDGACAGAELHVQPHLTGLPEEEAHVQAALNSYLSTRKRSKRQTGRPLEHAAQAVQSLEGWGGVDAGPRPAIKSPKRSKPGTPEEYSVPPQCGVAGGNMLSGGATPPSGSASGHAMSRLASELLSSFMAGAPGNGTGGGFVEGCGGDLADDDCVSHFLLDDFLGDPAATAHR